MNTKTLATTSAAKPAGNFRELLQDELVERCRKNPNYSLRSFAKFLGIEPSALSQIINNKRPVTAKMKLRLGTALGLTLVQLEQVPINENDIVKKKPAHKYQQQELDSFALISDWYHYAILELIAVKGFKPDIAWVAQKLGITKSEANIAVERLQRLGLLKITAKGAWIDGVSGGALTHLKPGVTSDAAKKFQCQLLELSKNAVKEVDVQLRNHTSAAFVFDLADMPQAIERISEFRRAFAKEFQAKKNAQEVYQMQISFFPLTKPSSN
jgi:plasmid maintenance system antidote protein VapI/DNA-binding Lrp family transcriptional regulator